MNEKAKQNLEQLQFRIALGEIIKLDEMKVILKAASVDLFQAIKKAESARALIRTTHYWQEMDFYFTITDLRKELNKLEQMVNNFDDLVESELEELLHEGDA